MRLNSDQAIAAGLVQKESESYLNANVVNISAFDGSPQHGLQCNFNQNRTLQIIGNTSHSGVGIASAEIHTKTLPVFQPQVKLGTDVNKLIYEIGYSAVWSGCLMNGAQAGSASSIYSDDTQAQIQRQNHAGLQTFQNDFGTVIVSDAYNNSFSLPTMDPSETVKHTLLKAFIDYHNASSNALFQFTPFQAFYIPSSYTPVIAMLPLRSESNNATITGTYVVVNDAKNFAIGDRVHIMGTSSTANNTDHSTYAIIRSICLYSDLIVSGSMKNPTSDLPNIISSTVIVFDAISGITATEVRTGGYIIDTHIDDIGGRVEFLVDQFEFREQTATLVSSSNVSTTNSLTVTIPTHTIGKGFLRKSNYGVPVEIFSSAQQQLNGVYYISTITNGVVLTTTTASGNGTTATLGFASATAPVVGSTIVVAGVTPVGYNGTFTVTASTTTSVSYLSTTTGSQTVAGTVSNPSTLVLKPATITAATVASYSGATAILKLAPNGYSIDCRPTTTNVNFLNCVGYKPTKELELCPPSYPPTITSTSRTFKRAYSLEIPFSTYRNLQWTTQDVDVNPLLPLEQQDFGNDGGSSYYNVYDFQQFINQSVNPALKDLIVGEESTLEQSLDELSLNQQLRYVSEAYQRAFVTDPSASSIVYDSALLYTFGNTIVQNGSVWTPQKQGFLSKPSLNNLDWFRIGDAPRTTALSRNLVFSYNATNFAMTFTCAGVTNIPETPERVRLMKTPKFKTQPLSFTLDGITNLLSYHADSRGFGMTFPYGLTSTVNLSDKYTRDLRNFNYISWGLKNATGTGGDETFEFESNSSFKFLFDNFSCNSIRYVEPSTSGLLIYWTWTQYAVHSYELPGFKELHIQSSESLSSSASPVQSIVVLSKSVPVTPSLLSPATIVSDSNTALVNANGVVGDSDSILGEFYIAPGMLSSCRSVIRYQPEQVTFYSLQSTKTFKQFDFLVCYRHRITQKLVPLNLSNYGSVNIKFVFKPT
jgi:hypothetical protein